MSNTITVQNAPRDLQGLSQINRTVRYRLGLSVKMWGTDQAAEEAFLALDDAGQAQALFTALQQYDASQGATAPAAAPAAAPIAAPQPMPTPINAPMAPHAPVPQAPPPMVAPQPALAPPVPQPPAPAPQAAPMRSPVTTADPNNSGAIAPQPMAAPPAVPAPTFAGGGGPPPTAPQPPPAPQTPTGTPGGQLVMAVQGLSQQVANLHKLVDDEVAGAADLQELKDIILGMARTQQAMGVMCLLLFENQLGMPRASVVNLVMSEIKQETLKSLLKQHEEAEGKG